MVTGVRSDDLLDLLKAERLLAIVRGKDPAAALRTLDVLAEEGVTLMEVSLTGADALSVIRRAASSLGPGVRLGAGTVLTARDAVAAGDAGATFVVTPGLGEGVDEAVRLGLPVIAGALTPTEVMSATARGATAVKLFPAFMGGVPYLRALRGPFPDVPFVAVGGVTLGSALDDFHDGTDNGTGHGDRDGARPSADDGTGHDAHGDARAGARDGIRDYLEAGAVAVGLGSTLLGDALNGGDPDDLRRRVRTVLEVVRAS